MQRAILALVVVGVLCFIFLPEASFLLPALDAIGTIGLDVVAILMLLELQRYLDGERRPTLSLSPRQLIPCAIDRRYGCCAARFQSMPANELV